MKSSPGEHPRSLRRTLWMGFWTLGVLAIAGLACTAMYANNRTVAMAEARKSFPFEFEPMPRWFPKQLPVPEWVRPVRTLFIDGASSDLSCVAAIHELEYLVVKGDQIDDRALRSVKAFRHLEVLEVFPPTRVTDAGFEGLHDCRRLKKLLIPTVPITDAGLQHIAALPLEELCLRQSRVTDAGLQHLAGMPLQVLDLTATHVSDAGVAQLQGLPLETLALDETRISDACLPLLAKMPLTSLSLKRAAVTARGLMEFRNHATLKELYVTGGPLTNGVHELSSPTLHVEVDYSGILGSQ